MAYAVKEIFLTLQGEGAQTGRAAVFLRFSGCNLWSGREEDRVGAVCRFCDTDFVGVDGTSGGRFRTGAELAQCVSEMWRGEGRRYVVCTGGEPLLQLDRELIEELHAHGFEIAIETNGTIPVPSGVDWVCVSPKIGSVLKVFTGNELKLVYPQEGGDPKQFEHLEFANFFLQPMDGPDQATNLQRAIDYCVLNPRWRLSLQTHKMIGIR